MASSSYEPDTLALLYVQQWLSERGLSKALAALEKECGLLYDDTKLLEGSSLMKLPLQLVWKNFEDEQSKDVDHDALAREAEEEQLLRGGHGDYPQTLAASIEGVHSSNIICVELWPGKDLVFTGSGDGYVRLVTFSGEVTWDCSVGSGGVLCLALHPQIESGCPYLAAGSMDGSLTLINCNNGTVEATVRPHTKYVVKAAWSGDGGCIATCAWDNVVAIQQVVPPDGSEAASISTVDQVPYTSTPQDITFLHDGKTLVVALKGTNYLRLLDITDPQALERKVNMNEGGDDHVSYSARHLSTSPCGRYLLVSTDAPRILMLRTSDWTHARDFYGLPVEQFHNPSALWHRSGHYVLAAAAGAQVLVFHVGSAKVVARLAGHKVNVRGLSYDALRNLLASCSYDKTVKIYAANDAPSASAS